MIACVSARNYLPLAGLLENFRSADGLLLYDIRERAGFVKFLLERGYLCQAVGTHKDDGFASLHSCLPLGKRLVRPELTEAPGGDILQPLVISRPEDEGIFKLFFRHVNE